MNTFIFGAVVAIVVAAPPVPMDGKSLIDLIESLQPQLEDFRCEFEGTEVYKTDEAKKELKLKEDGLADSFGGVFVWKTNGDTYLSTYHREEPEGKVLHERIAVRVAKHEAERDSGYEDDPVGQGVIDDPDFLTTDRTGSFGSIFLFDKVRRHVSNPNFHCVVSSDSTSGRHLAMLTFSFKNIGKPYLRYWMDLKRGGHGVREEVYQDGDALQARADVKLASFRVGGADFWMPVSGVLEDHTADKDGKTIYSEEPTSIETVYIIHGTLEFNKHPGPKTFTIAYKPGTPISDNIRKLKSEFGRQKTSPLPTRAEATAMLNEQVRQAEEQRKELLAGSPARDAIAWSSWLIPAFGGAALVGSVVLLIRRGRG